MTGRITDKLTEKKVKDLLVRIGLAPNEDDERVDAKEYNWRQPHYFNHNQLKKLDDFTKKAATAIAEKFTQLYRSDFNVTVVSTTQYFANQLLNPNDKQNDYHMAFDDDQGQPFGLTSIPAETAISLTTQLLGDSKSEEDSGRDLSQLELSLLLDVAFALIEALSDCYDNYNFQPAANIVVGQLPLSLAGSKELCKITFRLSIADSEDSSEAHFLIACSKLDQVVGENIGANGKISDEDISKAILAHIQKVPVTVTAQLARGMFTFEEIISLNVDDILLLDKKVTEPVELIVEGRTVLRGRPAKAAGKYAVVITELCSVK